MAPSNKINEKVTNRRLMK